VYYDEEGEAAFKIQHPGIDDGTFSEEESFSDRDLAQLRGVIDEVVPLLDTNIPNFAHSVYSALYAFDSHDSLVDPLYEECESLKAKVMYVCPPSRSKPISPSSSRSSPR